MSKLEWKESGAFLGEGASLANHFLFASPNGAWRIFARAPGAPVAQGEATDLASAKLAAEDAAAEILRGGLRALGWTCVGCWYARSSMGQAACLCARRNIQINQEFYCAAWTPREVTK